MREEKWILRRGVDVQHITHGRSTCWTAASNVIYHPVSSSPYMYSCMEDALLKQPRSAPTLTVNSFSSNEKLFGTLYFSNQTQVQKLLYDLGCKTHFSTMSLSGRAVPFCPIHLLTTLAELKFPEPRISPAGLYA